MADVAIIQNLSSFFSLLINKFYMFDLVEWSALEAELSNILYKYVFKTS